MTDEAQVKPLETAVLEALSSAIAPETRDAVIRDALVASIREPTIAVTDAVPNPAPRRW